MEVQGVPTLFRGRCWRNQWQRFVFILFEHRIMAIDNLYCSFSYNGNAPLPLVVVMHGYTGGAYSTAAVLDRMAAYGCFAASPGMRGRNSADGTPDASGREIYDIYDAITYIRAAYSGIVDSDKVCVVGYSGGGGNALAFASKFPDTAAVIVSHFGISDYGWADAAVSGLDSSWGWYPSNNVNLDIGGLPDDVPYRYRARHAVEGITNFTGGHLYIYHDDQDSSVPVIHSQRIVTALSGAGLSNYTTNYTTTTSSPRWTHGNPVIGDPGEPNIQTEPIWLKNYVDGDHAVWTISTSGTITVIGYIVTKRFTIWLNANGTATTGIDAVASVVYNTATDTYTVTPMNGAGGIDVTVTQGTKTGSATNITAETEIVVV